LAAADEIRSGNDPTAMNANRIGTLRSFGLLYELSDECLFPQTGESFDFEEFLEGAKDAVTQFSLISGRQFEKGYDNNTPHDEDLAEIEKLENGENPWNEAADKDEKSTEARLRDMVSEEVFDTLYKASKIIRDKGERFVLKDVTVDEAWIHSCRTRGLDKDSDGDGDGDGDGNDESDEDEDEEYQEQKSMQDTFLESFLSNENNMDTKRDTNSRIVISVDASFQIGSNYLVTRNLGTEMEETFESLNIGNTRFTFEGWWRHKDQPLQWRIVNMK